MGYRIAGTPFSRITDAMLCATSARDGWYLRQDFIQFPDPGAFAVTGTGVNSFPIGLPGIPGIYRMDVTAVGDRASWSTTTGALQQLLIGGGVITFEGKGRMAVLSDGVNNGLFQLGLGDAIAPGDHTDAVCFENDRNTNGSNNWFLVTSKAGVRTRTDLGVVALAATDNRLKAIIAADGSSVAAFIDDVQRATVATNMPNGGANQLTAMVRGVKQLGAGAWSAQSDYFEIYQRFSVQR